MEGTSGAADRAPLRGGSREAALAPAGLREQACWLRGADVSPLRKASARKRARPVGS